MVSALGVVPDEVVQLFIGPAAGSGRNLFAAVWVHRALREYLSNNPDAAPEVPPIVFVRHVVESNRWRFFRICGLQRHAASGLRAHRTDMRLIPVPARRGFAVVAYGDRQEMDLNVRVLDAGPRSNERSALEMIRCARTRSEQQPLNGGPGTTRKVPVLVQRYREFARLLHVDFQMILKVCSNAPPIAHNLDPEFLKMRTGSDPGKHQQLGRIYR